MKDFKAEYPDLEFFFIMGSDLLTDAKNWDEGLRLVNEVNFLIFAR